MDAQAHKTLHDDKCIHCNANTGNGVHANYSGINFTEMKSSLQQSTRRNQDFFLLYQPQINGLNNLAYGVEALVRWNYKGRIISPTEFIPVAESTHQICPIGEFVFIEACRKSQEWQQMGCHNFQGYLFSKPLNDVDLINYLQNQGSLRRNELA